MATISKIKLLSEAQPSRFDHFRQELITPGFLAQFQTQKGEETEESENEKTQQSEPSLTQEEVQEIVRATLQEELSKASAKASEASDIIEEEDEDKSEEGGLFKKILGFFNKKEDAQEETESE